jgi:hypothetical protein
MNSCERLHGSSAGGAGGAEDRAAGRPGLWGSGSGLGGPAGLPGPPGVHVDESVGSVGEPTAMQL